MKKITAYIFVITAAALVWACSLSACATAPGGRTSPGQSWNGKVRFSDPGTPFSIPRFFGHNTRFVSNQCSQTSYIINIMLSTDLGLIPILREGKNGKMWGLSCTHTNQAGIDLTLIA